LRINLLSAVFTSQSDDTKDAAFVTWLENIRTQAGNAIQIFDVWQNYVPDDPAFTWPPNTSSAELIPTPQPEEIRSYTFAITFDEIYRHPSGLFTIAIPIGWRPSNPTTTPSSAEITLQTENIVDIALIQISVQKASQVLTSLDDLERIYTLDSLATSWSSYQSYREVNRQRIDGKLVIDFRLQSPSDRFIARQVSWAEGAWVISLRVVAPEQRSALLVYLMDNLVANFEFTGEN
jgi:hypothetical protein